MDKEEVISITQEQEKEIVNILVHSSLYHGMSMSERKRLLHYLVASYFNPLSSESSEGLNRTTLIPSAQ